MSTVATYSYTHRLPMLTDSIPQSLKDVILLGGLDPEYGRIAGAIPNHQDVARDRMICKD